MFLTPNGIKRIMLIAFAFISVLILLTSCTCDAPVNRADSKDVAIQPNSAIAKAPLEVLGVYSVSGGNLYVYKFGTDTIYWAEGATSSYPVSIHVK